MARQEGPFEILYDGGCNVCRRTMRRLRRWDDGRGELRFVDATSSAFDPEHWGITFDDAMRKVWGREPGGELVGGMEVLRRAGKRTGRGTLLAPTGWPGLRPIFDALYKVVSKNRRMLSRLVGRPACGGDACGLDDGPGDSVHATGTGPDRADRKRTA